MAKRGPRSQKEQHSDSYVHDEQAVQRPEVGVQPSFQDRRKPKRRRVQRVNDDPDICQVLRKSGECKRSHSERRQFITSLAGGQINVRVIQALAQHKHANTMTRYIDINDVKLQNALGAVSMRSSNSTI